MTRNLYPCLEPAYSKGWGSFPSLTVSAREDISFWEANLVKLNGFAISPVTPSITSCEIIAGDASGFGLYAAKFSGTKQTVYSRKLTQTERLESSTYRECLTIIGIYMASSSHIHMFKRRIKKLSPKSILKTSR